MVLSLVVEHTENEEGVDHLKKLKGLETLSEAAQFKLNMKKARKASRRDFFIQQRPRGSGEGSGVTPEVPNELTLKSSNEGAGMIPEFPDEPSDYSSSSSSDSKFAAREEERGDGQRGNEQASDAQADVHVTVNEVLKDLVEHEVQSMVDIPVQQAKPTEQRLPLVDTTKSKKPDTYVDSGELKRKVTRLEKTVSAMSRFNLPEAIDKSVKAHLKNGLPKDVPEIGKIKMEKAGKKSLPKYSATPFDQTALDIYDHKDKLFKMMRECKAYNIHPTHKALYDALAVSLSVDEDDMDKQLEDPPVQKKRRMDDQDQDPPTNADKESKKKKRKDSDAPSSKKTKDQPTSSKKGTTPSKPSKPDKSVQAKETIEEPGQEEAMNDEEPAVDEVVNTEEHPQDDAGLSQDRSKWFKQSPRPETPDPDWHKEPNANARLKQTWFNDLVHAEKDPLTFDDLLGSIVDFTKNLQKQHRTGVQYGTMLFTLLDKLDWTNPEGDKCPFDLSKPLALQGPPEWKQGKQICCISNKDKSCKILGVVRLTIDNQFGYGYLKEIIVRSADFKECSFREAHFSRLHLYDIEDLFLFYVQRKIHNLTSDEIVHLKKLNITKPQTTCDGISFKEPYTIFHKPRGVVYLNKSQRKRLIRADELHKFSDGTLQMVHDNLDDMLHNFVLGYNDVMPKSKWSEKDQQRTDEMLKLIDNLLLERRIMRSFECYVGGRLNETDYRLRIRTM
ncbi:hypothetical protein Tco_1308590 [Tanacetum coccineum]